MPRSDPQLTPPNGLAAHGALLCAASHSSAAPLFAGNQSELNQELAAAHSSVVPQRGGIAQKDKVSSPLAVQALRPIALLVPSHPLSSFYFTQPRVLLGSVAWRVAQRHR